MTPVSSDGKASNNSRHTPERNTQQDKVENTNNSPTKSLEGCLESGSRDKKPRSSTRQRLGDVVVQVMVKYLLNLVSKFILCSENLSTKFLICPLILPLSFN